MVPLRVLYVVVTRRVLDVTCRLYAAFDLIRDLYLETSFPAVTACLDVGSSSARSRQRSAIMTAVRIHPHHPPQTPYHKHNPILSSSPAFATPLNTVKSGSEAQRSHSFTAESEGASRNAIILPILLPAARLRPIAFRTLTKKHNLTLTSQALQALATFIGRHCGAGWREEGLAELVLEEVAKSWKRQEAKVIVDANGDELKNILKQLTSCMSAGRIATSSKGTLLDRSCGDAGEDIGTVTSLLQRQDSFGLSSLDVEDETTDTRDKEPRKWLKVVGAFEQPRLVYNPAKKHFEKCAPVLLTLSTS